MYWLIIVSSDLPDFPYVLWLKCSVNVNSVFYIIIVYIIRSSVCSVCWYNALYDQTYDRVNSKMYALVVCNFKFENFEFK